MRPDHLGDVLVTLPALAALRTVLPDVTVTYAVAAPVAPICERSPYVDKVVSVPFPPLARPWHSAADPGVHAAAAVLQGRPCPTGSPHDLAVLPRPMTPPREPSAPPPACPSGSASPCRRAAPPPNRPASRV